MLYIYTNLVVNIKSQFSLLVAQRGNKLVMFALR